MKILCNICGFEMGETDNLEGIVDSRCDSCGITHGNFKDLMEKSKVMFNGDFIKAEEFVMLNRKKSEVDIALQQFELKKLEKVV